jgi:predicted dehydrogenase
VIRTAVIGLGYWGPNILRNLSALADVEVKVCADQDSKRLEAMKKLFPHVPEYVQDGEAVCKRDDIDAVAIVTPVESHHKLAKLALSHGKDVFVEKPMTSSVVQAEELIELANKNERILMVGHTFIFTPGVQKIKEILDSGEVGDVYYVNSTRINLGIHRRDVNVIWDLASHDFSMFTYWFDEEPQKVYSLGKDFILKGVPDVATLQAVYPSGIIANVLVSWLAPSKVRALYIVGSKKMVVYDDTQPSEKVRLYDSRVDLRFPSDYGEYLLTYRTGDIVSPRLDNFEPLRAEMGHFAECCKERKTPITDGIAGLRVVRILENAEKWLVKKSEDLGFNDK